jgi:hypothetical protein
LRRSKFKNGMDLKEKCKTNYYAKHGRSDLFVKANLKDFDRIIKWVKAGHENIEVYCVVKIRIFLIIAQIKKNRY